MNQTYIRECFVYCELTGKLCVRKRPYSHFTRDASWTRWNNRIGQIVGTQDTYGHLQTRLDGVLHTVHKLIWIYVYGNEPMYEINHIDQDPTNNKLDNLLDATRQVNMQNKRLYGNNKTGLHGVNHNGSSWIAYITVANSRIHLGSFKLKADAVTARKEAEIKYGYHPNHGRDPRSPQ